MLDWWSVAGVRGPGDPFHHEVDPEGLAADGGGQPAAPARDTGRLLEQAQLGAVVAASRAEAKGKGKPALT